MQSAWFYVALVLVFALVGPLFWLVTLSALLWVGYRVLPDRVGHVLFGHYWKKPGVLKGRSDGGAP